MGQHGGTIRLVHLSVSGPAWWYYKACSFISQWVSMVVLLGLFIYQSVGQHGGTIGLVHLSVSGSAWWYYKACSFISQWVSMVVL